MTVLGKVLVFVNLAFSLAVAFFISMAFAARTNRHDAFDDARAKLQAAEASRDQYAAEAAKARDDCKKDVAKVQDTLDKAVRENDRFKERIKDLDSQVAQQQQVIKQGGGNADLHKIELTRMTEQVKRTTGWLADANKRLDDMAKEHEEFRQRKVNAEIENRSLKERNDQLLARTEELEREVVRIKATAGGIVTTAGNAPNPPPGDVEGRVKNYDPQSGLITITVGSDAGILKGHTLFVYRLEPNGKYVGQMIIQAVRPTEAVGKMVSKPLTPVQINDKVGSKIS